MNRISFTYIGLVFALFGLGACSEKPETIPDDDSGTLQITTNIRATSTSRVSESGFDEDDTIGIFVANSGDALPTNGSASNNSFIYRNEKWNTEKPIFWDKTNTDVYGYMPYQKTVSNPEALPIKITDQDKGMTSNDFLYSNNVKDLVPGNVAHLLFDHLLSRVDIKIVAGNEWNAADKQRLAQTTLRILGTKTAGFVNLKDGTITLEDSIRKIASRVQKVNSTEGISSHSVILLPQNVAKTTTFIELSIKKANSSNEEQKLYYQLAIENGLDLLSGHKQSLTITINKDNINVSFGSVEPWLIGEEMNNESNNRPGFHTAQDLLDFVNMWNKYKIDPKERKKALERWQTVVGNDTIYYLWNDIDLNGVEWVPIGQDTLFDSKSKTTSQPDFNAIFDGQGFTISNLTIIEKFRSYHNRNECGMFATSNGTIRNVKLKNVKTSKELGTSSCDIGGLVCRNKGTIENCHIIGESILKGSARIGGLVCDNLSRIKNSSSSAKVIGYSYGAYVGGLVGVCNPSSNTTGCYATGDVSGRGNIGGLIGYFYSGSISDCHATGNVYNLSTENVDDFNSGENQTSYTGGLIGIASVGVSSCYATGNVTGGNAISQSYTGGLIGYGSTITDCYASGNVIGGDAKNGAKTESYTGGLVGQTRYPITGSYATGNVIGGNATSTGGQNYAGGLAGAASDEITKCHTTGDVTGCDATGTKSRSYTGGLIGYREVREIISECYATGKITGGYISGSESKGYTGGFIGMLESTYPSRDIRFFKNYASGDVFGGNVSGTKGDSRTGGLIGYTNNGYLDQCHASGNVWGGEATNFSYTGGLIGENAAQITNCYVSGNVTGKKGTRSHTGGLIGENNGSLFNNYTWGQVSGGTISGTNKSYCSTGGLVGNNASISENEISNCYAIGKVEGSNESVGGFIGYNNKDQGTIALCYWNKDNTTEGIPGVEDYLSLFSQTLFEMKAVAFMNLLNLNVATISSKTNYAKLLPWIRNEKGLPVLNQQNKFK